MTGYGPKRRSKRKMPARSYSSDDEGDNTLLNLLLQISRAAQKQTRRRPAAPKPKNKKKPRKNTASNLTTININSDAEEANVADDETKSHFENIQSSKIDNFFKSRMLLSDSEDDELLNDGKKNVNVCEEEYKDETNSCTSKAFPKDENFYTLSDSDEEYLKPNTYNKLASNKPSTVTSVDLCKPSTSAANDSIIEDVEKIETVEDILADVDLIAPKNTKFVPEKENEKEESWKSMLKETEEMLESVSKLVGIEKKEEPEKKTNSPVKSAPSCPICLESLADQEISATVCGHLFCKPCITAVLQSTTKKCPTCRKAINAKKIHPLYL